MARLWQIKIDKRTAMEMKQLFPNKSFRQITDESFLSLKKMKQMERLLK